MKADYLSRRENIILTTIFLFHEMGISNVSLKDIAKREGVSEASLYRHFSNKDDLVGAALEYYEQYNDMIHKTIQENEDSISSNLFKYFMIYAEYYNNYKEITAFVHAYEVLTYNQQFRQRTLELMDKKTDFLVEMIKEGQKRGELRKEIPPERLVDILVGSFERIISIWRLKDFPFSLKDKTEEVIGDILEAFGEKDTSPQ